MHSNYDTTKCNRLVQATQMQKEENVLAHPSEQTPILLILFRGKQIKKKVIKEEKKTTPFSREHLSDRDLSGNQVSSTWE